MLGNVMNSLKAAQGIRPLSDYVVINERAHAYQTVRFEVMFEEWKGQSYVRFKTTKFRGSGKNGRERKAFAWPVEDANEPVELQAWAEQILAATKPGAEVHDPRWAIGRLFDNLTGSHWVNMIPELARQPGPPEVFLRVRIYETKWGKTVTLIEDRAGRSQLWMTVPIETIVALRDHRFNEVR
ncbi:hypothetical protein [Synoicihabitans lomoniglobus]|uniref:Uncharacterized protein n=1 Tax=Synoicihabitans lomoniglobus TaxID=2909285 RepID=A0AAF0CSG9_9BACT|nr:hypothetical protein [Opitutaceae bacterium LMO-M01]WED67268.1 hypothetical protein PXH66_10440 [Opitutaceae bacterium LMO-M01]